MFENITFQNVLDGLQLRENRKNVFRTIIEPIASRITEIERSLPIKPNDIEEFRERVRVLMNLCINDSMLKDEARREVYKRLIWLMKEKIKEWENH